MIFYFQKKWNKLLPADVRDFSNNVPLFSVAVSLQVCFLPLLSVSVFLQKSSLYPL